MSDHDPDDAELRRWREDGRAPAGSCPFCASRISMIQRNEHFIARCSHRGCGAVGPKMRNITRAADLFCCPPPRQAQGTAVHPSSLTDVVTALEAEVARLRAFRLHAAGYFNSWANGDTSPHAAVAALGAIGDELGEPFAEHAITSDITNPAPIERGLVMARLCCLAANLAVGGALWAAHAGIDDTDGGGK